MSSLSLEQVLVSPRFKVAAAVLGIAVFLSTIGFLVAAHRLTSKTTVAVRSLPEKAYDIPILSSLPPPEPMVARAGNVLNDSTRHRSWITARR